MNICGIGKLAVDNTAPDWNYPHFHVIVFQEDGDDNYYAYCMELGIDAFSKDSGQKAFYNIATNVLETIAKYDVDSLFECLLNIAKSSHNDVFWKEYRIAETELARNADDPGNVLIDKLKQEIEQLRKELNKTHHDDQRIIHMGFHSLGNNKVA